MKEKYINYFMKVAEETANLSKCQRLKVGSVIVKDNRIISCGYNGLPAGWEPDEPETQIIIPEPAFQVLPKDEQERFVSAHMDGQFRIWYTGLKTLDETIHSEANSISRLAASSESGIGAYIFCTHTPCIQCAKIIYGSGITRVYYKHEYRSTSGLEFLKKCNLEVLKV